MKIVFIILRIMESATQILKKRMKELIQQQIDQDNLINANCDYSLHIETIYTNKYGNSFI